MLYAPLPKLFPDPRWLGADPKWLLRETPFRKAYIQCASTDDGTSLGAAFWCYHNVAGGTQRFHMQNAFWGPQYPQERLRQAAESCRMPMRHYDEQALLPAVARLLRAGLVVGWYQGRSEWGPRALGNRSILADPTRPDIKDAINLKMQAGDGGKAAVGHRRPRSPRLRKLCGVPVARNTSLNENEPIVDTPEQALDCLSRAGIAGPRHAIPHDCKLSHNDRR